MRAAPRAFVLLLLAASPLAAQDSARIPGPDRPAPAPRVTSDEGPAQAPVRLPDDRRFARLRSELRSVERAMPEVHLPPADSFSFGTRIIAAGETVRGSVGVAEGDLVIRGALNGDAVAIGGDVVADTGATISGNAISIGGHVVVRGGRVDGEMRSLSGVSATAATAARAQQPLTTWRAMKLVLGTFAILFLIGVGVLTFAEGNLAGVVIALERSFTKAFWVGLIGELALLPALLLLLVGLALTILGILLIPFAAVAFTIVAAGLVTLGFLGTARLTGNVAARRGGTERAQALRSLSIGLSLYAALWLLAAAFTWQPAIGMILRALAAVVTWVAVTAGLGAALISRAGTQRPGLRPARRPVVSDELAWQTPTPVTGVSAARRPRSKTLKEV